jgi:hypothetical protein
MRHHFCRPQAMFNKGSLFYSHCGAFGLALAVTAPPLLSDIIDRSARR